MTQETIIKNMLTDTSQSQKKRARTEQIQKKLLSGFLKTDHQQLTSNYPNTTRITF